MEIFSKFLQNCLKSLGLVAEILPILAILLASATRCLCWKYKFIEFGWALITFIETQGIKNQVSNQLTFLDVRER